MTLQTDKLLHALACYSISITLGLITNWWLGFLVAFLIGILKELRDLNTTSGTAEWGDILSDFTGAVLGSIAPFFIS